MKVAVAAYRLLLEVAEAHQGLSAEEISLLKRYRRALGISRAQILQDTATPICERMIEGPLREREQALLAMARVAHADGRLSPLERDRIIEVAARMGVGRMQVAHLLHQAEDRLSAEASKHRHLHTTRVLSAAGLAVVVFLAIFAAGPSLRGLSASEKLQAVAAENDSALLFLHVSYELTDGVDTREFGGTGTGFFFSPEGGLVTNKHVVQPWKFLASAVRLIDEGYELQPDSIVYSAWPVGARVKGDGKNLSFDAAYSGRHGTLELIGTCPDRWVKGRRALPEGGRHQGRYHALDDHDLAVLQATVTEAVDFIPLAASDVRIRPLDPIVVLGFPRGLTLFEGRSVVSAPSPGAVRNIEKSILLNAGVYPGNSGGPVLGESGEVLGVAARRVSGSDGLGRCIRVEHVRKLIASLH